MIAKARSLALTALVATTLLTPRANAGPGDADAARGIGLAKSGRCAEAIDLLEKAEGIRKRPSSGAALAGCYLERGEAIRPRDIYRAIAAETRSFKWDFYDVVEWRRAKANAALAEARIAKLTIETGGDFRDLSVRVRGVEQQDIGAPIELEPGSAKIEARATGFEPFERELELGPGDEARVTLDLARTPVSPPTLPPPRKKRTPVAQPEPEPDLWLGLRLRGLVIPRFVMEAAGDGGRTLFVPGAGVTLTTKTPGPELVVSIAYASYGMGTTPFKENGAPDTEYEIIESDLMSLAATLDILAAIPLDDARRVWLRVGGSVGIGWTFFGDLRRTQAYPPPGAERDPNEWVACDGPNDPPGSFRYCNQLAHDADHYDGYAEPSWFSGGRRPLIYPWLALPQLELSWRVARQVSLDLETGLTISGFLVGLGFRYGL